LVIGKEDLLTEDAVKLEARKTLSEAELQEITFTHGGDNATDTVILSSNRIDLIEKLISASLAVNTGKIHSITRRTCRNSQYVKERQFFADVTHDLGVSSAEFSVDIQDTLMDHDLIVYSGIKYHNKMKGGHSCIIQLKNPLDISKLIITCKSLEDAMNLAGRGIDIPPNSHLVLKHATSEIGTPDSRSKSSTSTNRDRYSKAMVSFNNFSNEAISPYKPPSHQESMAMRSLHQRVEMLEHNQDYMASSIVKISKGQAILNSAILDVYSTIEAQSKMTQISSIISDKQSDLMEAVSIMDVRKIEEISSQIKALQIARNSQLSIIDMRKEMNSNNMEQDTSQENFTLELWVMTFTLLFISHPIQYELRPSLYHITTHPSKTPLEFKNINPLIITINDYPKGYIKNSYMDLPTFPWSICYASSR